MAHPAQAAVNAHRISREQPGAVDPQVRGQQRHANIHQVGKVDASTWRPPAARDLDRNILDGNLKLDKREQKEPKRY